MQKPRKVSNICTIYTYKSVSFPTENDPGNAGKHYFFVVISSLLVEIGILKDLWYECKTHFFSESTCSGNP